MQMAPENAISFFFIIFLFAITPGPGVFALLARSLASGARPCLSLALGMAISDVIYLLLTCFGLAVIAEQWAEVFVLIRIAGAFYLVYLGVTMWTAPVATSMKNKSLQPTYSISRGLLQGFLISASNPKVIFFYVAFLPTILNLNNLTAADIALASGLTFTSLMLGLMLIAVCASSARRFFTSGKTVKNINRISGGIMIGVGSYLGLNG